MHEGRFLPFPFIISHQQDVQLQPQDQPIAEEELGPHQLQSSSPGTPCEAEIQTDVQLLPGRSNRLSLGGLPSLTSLSPGGMLFRGSAPSSSAAACVRGSGGGTPWDECNPEVDSGAIEGRGMFGDNGVNVQHEADVETGSTGGALGHQLGHGVLTSPFGAALAAGPVSAAVSGAHRKHRSDKQKKAPLVSTHWLKIDLMGRDTIICVDKHKVGSVGRAYEGLL